MNSVTRFTSIAVGGVVIANIALGDFRTGQLAVFLSLALLAVSLDLVWGYTGILSLGQLLPFGTAAYVTARIATAHPDWSLAALVVSVIVGALLSMIIAAGAFHRRLSLVVVGLLTLMLSLTFEQIAEQWRTQTGGFNGLSGIPTVSLFGWKLEAGSQDLLTALVAVIAIAGVLLLVQRPIGAVLIGIRDNERRMEALGYHTTWIKIWVYSLGGALAGLAGWLNAHQTGFVSPGRFGFVLATNLVLWTLIGGRGTITGPVIGTLLINFASAALADTYLQYWVLATGVIFIAAVVFVPDGLVPSVLNLFGRPARRSRDPRFVPLPPSEPTAKVDSIITADGIDKSYGPFSVLDDVTLTMEQPELRCLIGPNGAGKTTFLDILCGQQGHQSGTLTMFGESFTGKPAWLFARLGISRKFQAPQVIESLSIAENIAIAAWAVAPSPWRLTTRSWTASVSSATTQILQRTGLEERRRDRAGDLSHGEQQWLEIAMAMAGRCRLLLLDEPTAGMTVAESLDAAALLRDIHTAHHLPIVIVEHDMAFIRAVADRVTVLARGGLIADGSVVDVENDPAVRSVYLGVPEA